MKEVGDPNADSIADMQITAMKIEYNRRYPQDEF